MKRLKQLTEKHGWILALVGIIPDALFALEIIKQIRKSMPTNLLLPISGFVSGAFTLYLIYWILVKIGERRSKIIEMKEKILDKSNNDIDVVIKRMHNDIELIAGCLSLCTYRTVQQASFSGDAQNGFHYEFEVNKPTKSDEELTPDLLFWIRDKQWNKEFEKDRTKYQPLLLCKGLFWSDILLMKKMKGSNWIIVTQKQKAALGEDWKEIQDFRTFLLQRFEPVLNMTGFSTKGSNYNPFKLICEGRAYYQDLWNCHDILMNHADEIKKNFKPALVVYK
jgi:hypothetical protein